MHAEKFFHYNRDVLPIFGYVRKETYDQTKYNCILHGSTFGEVMEYALPHNCCNDRQKVPAYSRHRRIDR